MSGDLEDVKLDSETDIEPEVKLFFSVTETLTVCKKLYGRVLYMFG
jgi:hypothetical protein